MLHEIAIEMSIYSLAAALGQGTTDSCLQPETWLLLFYA